MSEFRNDFRASRQEGILAFEPFTINLATKTLLKDGVAVDIEPKPFQMLELLLREPGKVVTYTEFKAELWPEVSVEVNENVNTQIGKLRKALGKSREHGHYILTKHKHGYFFNPGVPIRYESGSSVAGEVLPPPSPVPVSSQPRREPQPTPGVEQNPTTLDLPLLRPFGGHWKYVILVSALYALLFAETLILEVAYRFNDFGRTVLVCAPAIFFWVAITSVLILAVDWWMVKANRPTVVLSVPLLYASALLLQIGLHQVLPAIPVTEELARQPQSAQAAYLKNVVLYFLPLASIYMLLPFHFVIALQRELQAARHCAVLALLTGDRNSINPKGTVYLRVSWLGTALFFAGLLSVALTQNLFDHLRPGRYMNLFMLLALGRTFLYFVTALICLLWYARTLNEIKRECLVGNP